MPARTPKQQRAAGADKARCEKGKKPMTFPTCALASEFAHKPPGGYGALAKRSTKGSPAFTVKELKQGYRRAP